MFNIIIIICLIVIYILLLLWQEKNNIQHIYLSFISDLPYVAIPTNPILLKNVNKIINKNILDKKKYTFIDFGSGCGDLVKQIHQDYYNTIGIEINKEAHNKAISNCINKSNIILKNIPMQNYYFSDVPSILYMYDPLFELNDCNEIDKIYDNVLINYDKIKNTKYILFISGIKNNYSYLYSCKETIFTIFNNHGYELIDKLSSNLWPLTRYMYLYKK